MTFSYSSAGDTISIVICIICWLFLKSTYTHKQSNLTLFYIVNRTLLLASVENIIYNTLLDNMQPKYVYWIYVLENSIYIQLALVFYLFVVYMANLFEMQPRSKKILYSCTFPVFIAFAIYKLFIPFFKVGFYIDDNLVIHDSNMFVYYYIYFSLALVILIRCFRNRLIPQIVKCLYSVVTLSFLVTLIEYLMQTTTFLCVSFTFPVVAALFFFHYNAYDTRTGTLDFKAFHAYIKDLKDKPYAIFCLYLKDTILYDNPELSQTLIHFTDEHFKEYCLFRISDNKIFLVYANTSSLNDELLTETIRVNFDKLYQKYRIPYKLVHIASDDVLKNGDDVIELDNFINNKMQYNTLYECTEKDLHKFARMRLIESTLYDICEKKDLDDPRVKVYCQPVFDIKTHSFQNAEALLRLDINGTMFFPDDIIPVAEKHGYIHTLSKIMLNKVCKYIKELIVEDYVFERISINFSTMEFGEPNFCNDIVEIVRANNIPPHKLAIEVTESNNDVEYSQVKESIKMLNLVGIKFYLDDFGTGYSNFQRIFALPFDVIKFDRSVTILSGESEDLYYSIKGLANIFMNAGYKVLFEGVETIEDERRCKDMYASYLQGYEYSMPIPIENLKEYFKKEE